MLLTLHSEIIKYFSSQQNIFNYIMTLRGEVYREREGRRTQKIILEGENYFIKQHFGVGWKEIFKNLLQLRWPVLSARNEWRATQYLKKLNIATLETVGYGCRGINPARLQSFLITQELADPISLEDFCKDWRKNPPDFSLKKKLIKEVAKIARTLHTSGINHRDFYICHFLLTKELKLYLIDLHRAQIRERTPLRWIIKDLAGLYFSSFNIGLTKKDIFRFIKEYCQKPISEELSAEAAFWEKVKKRGDKLYRKHEK